MMEFFTSPPILEHPGDRFLVGRMRLEIKQRKVAGHNLEKYGGVFLTDEELLLEYFRTTDDIGKKSILKYAKYYSGLGFRCWIDNDSMKGDGKAHYTCNGCYWVNSGYYKNKELNKKDRHNCIGSEKYSKLSAFSWKDSHKISQY